jgi:hypothetical protein
LANLLWSKTIGANSLKPEDGNIRKMIVYDKENGSEHSNLPLDFSTTTYSIDVSTRLWQLSVYTRILNYLYYV